MTRLQWMVLVAIAALLITLCWVEVMRGEDPWTANKEALVTDLRSLAIRAQAYYHESTARGGGEGSFLGLTADAPGLAKLTPRSHNANGTYIIRSSGTSMCVQLSAVGTQLGTDGQPLLVIMSVFPDSTSFMFAN